jgi:uncharacterized SAM-binding protein YcdF (DUF218 family)
MLRQAIPSLGRTVVFVALASALLTPAAVRVAGTSLVIDEPLEHSRAIVVFGGAAPFRSMEAATLYKQGWAPEVWVTTGRQRADDVTLARLGIERPPEHYYNLQVLERLGVPSSAIRVLGAPVANTAEEIGVIAERLRHVGGGNVILVTSQYHTRRVRFFWRRVATPGAEARVHYARGEPLDPRRWWSNSTEMIAVAREWVGMINALASFPIQTVHD